MIDKLVQKDNTQTSQLKQTDYYVSDDDKHVKERILTKYDSS